MVKIKGDMEKKEIKKRKKGVHDVKLEYIYIYILNFLKKLTWKKKKKKSP